MFAGRIPTTASAAVISYWLLEHSGNVNTPRMMPFGSRSISSMTLRNHIGTCERNSQVGWGTQLLYQPLSNRTAQNGARSYFTEASTQKNDSDEDFSWDDFRMVAKAVRSNTLDMSKIPPDFFDVLAKK